MLCAFGLQILERLSTLSVTYLADDTKRNRKHEQRLLRNMGAHTVVLELLQIPYEKVHLSMSLFLLTICCLGSYMERWSLWTSIQFSH